MSSIGRGIIVSACALGMGVAVGRAATIADAYSDHYMAVDLGQVGGLPAGYAGLTFIPGDPNTLLIGAAGNTSSGVVYTVSVQRDAQNHITGFGKLASFYASTFGSSGGGIDGGVGFGPGGFLFFSSFPDNRLGEVKPGFNNTALALDLTAQGYSSSVGAMSFLPTWLSGYDPNVVKLASFTSSTWYSGNLLLDTNKGSPTYGMYLLSIPTSSEQLTGGPEGIAYFQGGTEAEFSGNTMLMTEYKNGQVVAYDIDGNGDPIVNTRRVFVEGLSGAEGAVLDPLTGDFLFSTTGGSDSMWVVEPYVARPTPADPVPVPMALPGGLALLAVLGVMRKYRTA